MLGLAHVQLNILGFSALADDHAGVYFLTGADEQGAPVLGVEQSVGHRLPALEGDEGTLAAVLQVSLVGGVALKNGIDDAVALGVGHKVVAEADQASGGNGELQTGVAAGGFAHALQFSFAQAQLLDHGAGKFVGTSM